MTPDKSEPVVEQVDRQAADDCWGLLPYAVKRELDGPLLRDHFASILAAHRTTPLTAPVVDQFTQQMIATMIPESTPVVEQVLIAAKLEEWDMKDPPNDFTGHTYEDIAKDILDTLAKHRTTPLTAPVVEQSNYEELTIRHGRQVTVTFKDSADAFALFNELKARTTRSSPTGDVERVRLADELERRWQKGCTVGGMLETSLAVWERAEILKALRAALSSPAEAVERKALSIERFRKLMVSLEELTPDELDYVRFLPETQALRDWLDKAALSSPADERGLIVAWLRQNTHAMLPTYAGVMNAFADAIERGDHRHG